MRNSKKLNAALRTDRSAADGFRVMAMECTTSELRVKTKAIVQRLSKGQSVRLFKRGHPLGEIIPVPEACQQYFEVVGYTRTMIDKKVSDVMQTDLWNDDQKMLIRLRIIEKMSLAQVSDVLKISRWAVTKNVRAALKLIGERYVSK
jgi:antitoxin (DNA-binding transcriptional repressor) of toxin-antitoxin stability system